MTEDKDKKQEPEDDIESPEYWEKSGLLHTLRKPIIDEDPDRFIPVPGKDKEENQEDSIG